jgi:hypothetical protein
MSSGYLPRGQSQALAWMKAFAGGLVAHWSRYMVSPSDAAAVQQAVDQYEQALATATSPKTRTQDVILAKDQARVSAEQICRLYYSLIKPNAGISDPDKIAIGVRPQNVARQRIHCPQTSPLIDVIAATPHSHTLRYRDSMTPESSAKPFGAMQLQLFLAIDDDRKITNVSEASIYGCFTRNPACVSFDHKDDGRMASYFGRWVSRRGDVGPWSLPKSFRIAA